MSSDLEDNIFGALSEDEEDDWEEVEVPEHLEKHLEITIQTKPTKADAPKKKGISHAERLLRIDLHKMHTVVLLGNAKVRNEWINDETLQARLLSLTPLKLQNEFALIHKSRIPEQAKRGRAFENAIRYLAEWWAHTFFEVLPEGHIRNRIFDEVQLGLAENDLLNTQPDGSLEPIDQETTEAILGSKMEVIRGPKSLMKHALMGRGSRDLSSQLFTSLCRALGIPARLVVSLQSVPWKASIGRPPAGARVSRKDKGKGKGKAVDKSADEQQEDRPASSSSSKVDIKGKGKAPVFEGSGQRLNGAPVPKSEKAKGKEKAKPVIKLRKQRDKGHRLGDATPPPTRRYGSLGAPDPTKTPPVFWTEVFSRPDGRWLPVDPIRAIVNERKVFDPTPPTNAPGTGTSSTKSTSSFRFPQTVKISNVPKGFKEENRMLYVLAFEEDGYARDVTRRYALEYSARVAKAQGGSGAANAGGGAKARWWEKVVNLVQRPYQLHRDDMEDEELTAAQMREGMPTSIAGFKDHPLYVLERHLKQTEVIHPPPPDTPALGKFRGEPVYSRSAVVALKTADTWMRTEGRIIKAGSQPLKSIKARAGTVNRQRELEVLRQDLREAGQSVDVNVMQGLYSHSQTELYVPESIKDGKIPKNYFGNIDLYVPSMLPEGAVHVPFKGVAKIAKKLGFDYAEAVTRFEFKKRRAHPVIEGVVIAAENESVLLEAYWEAQKKEEERIRAKKEEKALQHWIKLVHGLRIRQRLQEQYADRTPATTKASTPSRSTKKGAASALNDHDEGNVASENEGVLEVDTNDADGRGGFLVEADDVVKAFHLPKYNPVLLLDSESSNPFARSRSSGGPGTPSNPGGNAVGLGITRGSATATGSRNLRADLEDEYEDEDEHEERAAIEYVTYDLDDHQGTNEGVPMDVDMDRSSYDGIPDVDMDTYALTHATPGPPLTEPDHLSPLSLGDLESDRKEIESSDTTDNDATKPRTMQELLQAEEDAKARATPKRKVKLSVGDTAGELVASASISGAEGAATTSGRRRNPSRSGKRKLMVEEDGEEELEEAREEEELGSAGVVGIPGGAGSSGPNTTARITGKGGRQVRSGRSLGSSNGGAGSVSGGGTPQTGGSMASKRNNATIVGADDVTGGDDVAPVSASPAGKGGKRKKGASAAKTGVGRKKAGAKAKTATPSRRSTRGKKRKDDSEDEAELSLDEAQEELPDVDDHDEDLVASPRKRPRVEDSNVVVPLGEAAAATSTPSSGGRSLRPRRSKTAAQLEQDKEAEKAYKRAIAQ
ncbi:Rad4-domain-containing protein [Coprinopsis marcescibilis]|uniref:Rad4-domain-containing protein n=1 Tax=Coprinopsis marcescibilis TaxID=230819 RepID=A0A5C3KRL7_COPMA|nr:Rad4-domain-containing protein [Coprinopsis marcescibilis]